MNKYAYAKMMGLDKRAIDQQPKTFLQIVKENQTAQKEQEDKRNAFLSGNVGEDLIKSPVIRTVIQATTPEARFDLLTGRYKPDTLPSQFREALNAAAKKDLNTYNNYKNKGWWERLLAWFQQMYARFSGGNEGATLRGGAQNAKNRFLQYFASAPTAAQNKLIQ